MKDCVVSIKGFQSIDDDSDVIEMKAIGKYIVTDEKILIVYHEIKSVGEDVRVLVKIFPDNKIIIERSGALQNDMIIEKGKRNCSYYSTSQGNLFMGIYGLGIYSEISSNSAFVSAEYQLDIEGNVVSTNKIEITVKEV